MDNLEETDRFLERYSLSRLNQDETENTNKPITSHEIETVAKNFPENESPVPNCFTDKFYEAFREELTSTLLKLFQKNAEDGTLPSSFNQATITLIPKPGKDNTKK